MRAATDRLLPRSSRLFNPPRPDLETMDRFSRVETVPVSSLRRTQSRMGWDDFLAGRHPGHLVDGYGDRPVVVRMRDGENLVYDGHHRTVLALLAGSGAIEVHVVDAEDYAPEAAGPRPRKEGSGFHDEDEAILAELLGEDADGGMRPGF